MSGLILAAMLLVGLRFIVEGARWFAEETSVLLRLGALVSVLFGLWAVSAAAGMLT